MIAYSDSVTVYTVTVSIRERVV